MKLIMRNLKIDNNYTKLVKVFYVLGFFTVLLLSPLFVFAQTDTTQNNSNFRIGEKITYQISFNTFKNAAVAEIHCVSRGKIQGKDAVELRLRMKTVDFVSVAYHNVDESRIVFASMSDGIPIFTKVINEETGFPIEKVRNLFLKPTSNFDLLSAIYQIRKLAGTGNISLQDDEASYLLSSSISGSAKLKTDIGEFDTTVSILESQYFTEKGISNVSVYLSNDEREIPVLIRFKTNKGEFTATVASIQDITPETEVVPSPTPKATPIPLVTPKPVSTPEPYKDNQPLSTELPFTLGEKLTYELLSNGQQFANVNLHVKERKLLNKQDNVVFEATISNTKIAGQNIDFVRSLNDTNSLTPNIFEIKLSGIFSKFNQTVQFNQSLGLVSFGSSQTEIPIGTYDLLSFAYAIRSFNLKPSKDASNPVNDTRVAVFIGSKAVVFTLRPQITESIEFNGRKISVQKISFSTGNPSIDSLSPQLWLSNDRRRLPLKFSVTIAGKVFIAQLINVSN
jgi:hypothetical protein